MQRKNGRADHGAFKMQEWFQEKKYHPRIPEVQENVDGMKSPEIEPKNAPRPTIGCMRHWSE